MLWISLPLAHAFYAPLLRVYLALCLVLIDGWVFTSNCRLYHFPTARVPAIAQTV